ncbi:MULTISPECIES: DUF4224 domain-containing protein [unclassified Leclercia]|uniref:DUF4224 domain-containing protein n=1 Tax=unclassified Leclercia TaxID=2627398 RepID=UPI00257AF140|nr:DUF4224 domain-containing protein [Leclercia sp. UBA5958]
MSSQLLFTGWLSEVIAMHELTLSPAEIAEITGYRRYTEQQRQLRCHGIPFTTDGRNRPIVLRRNLAPNTTELPKVDEHVATEPDYDAIYGKTTKGSKGRSIASAGYQK